MLYDLTYMRNQKQQTNKTYEQRSDCGCQRWEWEVGKLGEGGQKIQTSSHKINKFWRCKL